MSPYFYLQNPEHGLVIRNAQPPILQLSVPLGKRGDLRCIGGGPTVLGEPFGLTRPLFFNGGRVRQPSAIGYGQFLKPKCRHAYDCGCI